MYTLNAEVRSPQVKAKHLRKAGFLPCCIYGIQLEESISIQVPQTDADRLLRQVGVGGTVDIHVAEKKYPVLIKEIARNALKNEVEHVGFQAMDANTKLNTTARIQLINREKVPGFIGQVLFEVPYSAYPADLIDTITIDMETIAGGGRIAVADLEIAKNENIQILIDTESIVVTVTENARAAVETEETEETEE